MSSFLVRKYKMFFIKHRRATTWKCCEINLLLTYLFTYLLTYLLAYLLTVSFVSLTIVFTDYYS